MIFTTAVKTFLPPEIRPGQDQISQESEQPIGPSWPSRGGPNTLSLMARGSVRPRTIREEEAGLTSRGRSSLLNDILVGIRAGFGDSLLVGVNSDAAPSASPSTATCEFSSRPAPAIAARGRLRQEREAPLRKLRAMLPPSSAFASVEQVDEAYHTMRSQLYY